MTDIKDIRKYIDCTLLSFYEKNEIFSFVDNESEKAIDDSQEVIKTLTDGVVGNQKVLDFGCGDAAYLEYLSTHFDLVEGCDISDKCIDASIERLSSKNIDHNIYKVNYDLIENIPDNNYDLIYSIRVFQHIPVYTLRKIYLEQFYNKLKTGGTLFLQMCAGDIHFSNDEWGLYSDYYEDSVETRWTNSRHDVRIKDVEVLEKDLSSIGFKNIRLDTSNYEDHVFFRSKVNNDCWMYHDKVVIARCEK
jgi:ubiquinone/menaquinone biosynthesis C-methylase UbiE